MFQILRCLVGTTVLYYPTIFHILLLFFAIFLLSVRAALVWSEVGKVSYLHAAQGEMITSFLLLTLVLAALFILVLYQRVGC